MYKKISLNGKALSVIMALAATVALSYGPIGCSKEKAPPQQTAPQPAQSVSPAKEHFDKGVQFMMKNQLDEAIKEFEATLQIDPKSAEAHNNLGFAYYDKGDIDKAIEHQKMAVEANPNLANAYYGLAMALEKKGDKAGAITSWKEFMKLSQPHSKWWMQAQSHIKNLEGKASKTTAAAPATQQKK